MPADEDFYYEGFSSPNGTIVPDDVFDVLAPRLKESELRVLLYIVRRTFGFGKQADAISLNQLTDGITARDGRIIDYGTGMSKKAVIQGVKGLATKGVIEVDRRKKKRGHNAVNIYRLRFRSDETVVTKGNPHGGSTSPPVVTSGNPQETESQETESHNNMAVVANEKNSVRNNRIYETLKKAGVHHNTAAKLLEEYDEDRILAVLEHVRSRIREGWMPNRSGAAWIVAALRDEYDLPDEHTEQWVIRESAAQAAKISEEQNKQLQEEFRRARQEKAALLTGDSTVDAAWLSVQEEMKERGTWVPVLASSFLKIEGERAVILVPKVVLEHAQGIQSKVAEALHTTDMMSEDIQRVEIATYEG